ncbi:MAG: queuosine precursor transporter [Nanoarchaeota archaeon]|nr:queuosine precursor transporter [Nanoarchaeota archaeon]
MAIPFQNEILWVALLIVTFLSILLAYKLFGKTGLYAWTAIAVILANIQVMKLIKIFGFVTAEGNIIYCTTYLASDILMEKYGRKAAKKAIWIGFFILLATTVIMQLLLAFTPDASDTFAPALAQIFGVLPRILIASLAAYLVSQHLEVSLFLKIKEKMQGKLLWVRNTVTSTVVDFVDNAIFTWIAFVGLGGLFGWTQVFDWPTIISIFWTSYALKWVIAFCDNPFLYWAKKINKFTFADSE